MSRAGKLCRMIVEDAHTLDSNIGRALQRLHDDRGGYPSSTPGAAPATPGLPPDYTGRCMEKVTVGAPYRCSKPRPCPDHDTAITLTQPERGASSKDPASKDKAALERMIVRVAKDLRRLSDLAARWGNPALTGTEVESKLADELVCKNCRLNGGDGLRQPKATECWSCAEFRRDYGVSRDRWLIDYMTRNGKRPSSNQIVRHLDDVQPGWRKRKSK